MITVYDSYNLEIDGPAVDITFTPAEFEHLLHAIDAAADLLPDGLTADYMRHLFDDLDGSKARKTLAAWRTGHE